MAFLAKTCNLLIGKMCVHNFSCAHMYACVYVQTLIHISAFSFSETFSKNLEILLLECLKSCFKIEFIILSIFLNTSFYSLTNFSSVVPSVERLLLLLTSAGVEFGKSKVKKGTFCKSLVHDFCPTVHPVICRSTLSKTHPKQHKISSDSQYLSSFRF